MLQKSSPDDAEPAVIVQRGSLMSRDMFDEIAANTEAVEGQITALPVCLHCVMGNALAAHLDEQLMGYSDVIMKLTEFIAEFVASNDNRNSRRLAMKYVRGNLSRLVRYKVKLYAHAEAAPPATHGDQRWADNIGLPGDKPN